MARDDMSPASVLTVAKHALCASFRECLALWRRNCVASRRLHFRSPHGGGFSTDWEESHGEGMGGHRDRGGGDRIVLAGGAGDRVGDIQLHAVLPGDRDGGRRRGLALARLLPGSTLLSRLWVGKGGVRAPFLFLVLLLVFSVGLVFVRPSPLRTQDRDPGAAGTVYRRPLGHDPKTLDPARVSDIYSLSVSQQIFDGLVQYDSALTIVPALAEFWRASRDGAVWTFNLRHGVKFHHGREVNADDVVYSFARILDPKTRSGAAELFLNIKGAREFREGRAKSVSGLVALDRRTVQVTLDDHVAPFVAIAAVGHAKIVPRDLVEAQGEAFGAQPVGSGPFRFLRWERGKEIVLTANVEHFEGAPKLARLVFRIFPGDQRDAMHEEFLRGGLEDAPLPSHADRRTLGAGDGHIYVKRPMSSVRFYGFNMRMKPLSDRRVRQAFLHAIDREAIVQNVYFGQYTLARG